jgi:hypothetical protein
MERFERAADMLQTAFTQKILRHICNSAGAERFTDAQYDMVRLGIGLYGISPIGKDSMLAPISTLKTIILQIHDELIVEGLDSELAQVREILDTCMRNAADLAVDLVCDIHTGKTWYELK